MPEIPEIQQRTVSVPEIPSWQIMPPQSIPSEPPVTLLLGFPVAEIPGCVETRDSQPGNADAYDTDPRGNFVVCGGNMPSFNAPSITAGTAIKGTPPAPKIDPDVIKEPAGSFMTSGSIFGAGGVPLIAVPAVMLGALNEGMLPPHTTKLPRGSVS